ncbi:DegT/DnrJ/EryC1/StrS family aminotransferase [Flavobacteriaceae bacterium]|nr:DegT/DnrJ/EryC1/StrS family aminotransferase [Flavobacteriaceae bacterium]
MKFYSMASMNELVHQEVMESFSNFFKNSNYILGPNVEKFENEYSNFNGTQFCIGTSNGLDSLILCLKSLNIGKGDEVIVPSNTFIATVLAVIHCGATPVFVEPDKTTYNLNYNLLEDAFTANTKAVIAVNLYGNPCDFTNILKFTQKRKIYLIEDNAQAQGASWDGQFTGSFGDVNAVSFYPGKNLGAFGDAGAVTTNSKNLDKVIRSLRNYGSSIKYHNEFIGHNFRMDECQAGFLSIKLKYIDSWNNQRIKISKLYFRELSNIDGLILPTVLENAKSVFHIFNIRTTKRDQLKEFLGQNGIETLIHYPIPPHLQDCFKYLNYKEGSFPVAEELARTSLSLPIWPGIKEEDVFYIIGKIKSFFYDS